MILAPGHGEGAEIPQDRPQPGKATECPGRRRSRREEEQRATVGEGCSAEQAGTRSPLATVTFVAPWCSSWREVPRVVFWEMKLWVEPLFRQAGAPTEIDVHLHGLASADPNDGVEGNVRSPLHHCVVDRSLLFVHTI